MSTREGIDGSFVVSGYIVPTVSPGLDHRRELTTVWDSDRYRDKDRIVENKIGEDDTLNQHSNTYVLPTLGHTSGL